MINLKFTNSHMSTLQTYHQCILKKFSVVTFPQLSFTKCPRLSKPNVPEIFLSDFFHFLFHICFKPGSSSLRIAISIVFFGPIFSLLLSCSGSRLTFKCKWRRRKKIFFLFSKRFGLCLVWSSKWRRRKIKN